ESHTGQYLEPAAGGGTERAPIDLGRALAGDEVVVFSLNSSRYGALAGQLGTLVVQDLIAASGRRLASGDRELAVVGIDEFSGLPSDNVVSLFVRSRESGISVLVAT